MRWRLPISPQRLACLPPMSSRISGSKNALVDALGFEQIGAFERQICPLDKSHAPLSRLRHLARNLMEQHHQDLNKNPYVFEMILMTAKQDMKCGDYYKSVIVKLLAEIIQDGVEAGIYNATDILLWRRPCSTR